MGDVVWRLHDGGSPRRVTISSVPFPQSSLEKMHLAPWLRIQETLSVRKRSRDLPTLRKLVSPHPHTRLLDLGGGAGSATARFASGCRKVVMLEPNRRKIRLGRSLHPGFHFVEGQAEALPFVDESFDVVVGVVSFHHVSDPAAALREAHRVLRRSGRIVLHELYPVHHASVAPRLLGTWFHGSKPQLFTPDELKGRLESQGFREVSTMDGVRGYFVWGIL